MTKIARHAEARVATKLLDRYLSLHAATDLEGVLSLFAKDATLEDPVGAPIHHGLAAIRAFYRETHSRIGKLDIERIGPVLTGGDEIAAHVRARLESPDDAPEVDVIYTLRLDDEGRIASLRAFF